MHCKAEKKGELYGREKEYVCKRPLQRQKLYYASYCRCMLQRPDEQPKGKKGVYSCSVKRGAQRDPGDFSSPDGTPSGLSG